MRAEDKERRWQRGKSEVPRGGRGWLGSWSGCWVSGRWGNQSGESREFASQGDDLNAGNTAGHLCQ